MECGIIRGRREGVAVGANGDKGRSFSASGGFREAVEEELILGVER